MSKILLLSHHRSGSTLYVESVNSRLKKEFPQFFPCISEVYSEEWKIRREYMEHFNLPPKKFEEMDVDMLTSSFLHTFRLENFIIKYFPYSIKRYCSEFLTMEYIMQRCIDDNVEVHFLYRKNLLQCAISYLISRHTNIWHNNRDHDIQIDYYSMRFQENFIDNNLQFLLSEVSLCHQYYYKFLESDLINVKLTYEDNISIRNFTYSQDFPNEFKKLNNEVKKEIVLSNNPKILEYLKKYTQEHGLNCTEEFILEV